MFPDSGEELSDEDLPAWLKEAQAEDADSAMLDLETVASVQPGGDLVDEADLPDWLQEVETDGEDVFEPSEPSPEPLDVVSDEEILIEDELPDWLQEVPEETLEASRIDVAEFSPSEPVASLEEVIVEDQDMPGWLQEFDEDTDISEVVEAWPVVAAERVPEVSLEPQPLLEEEIPSWLAEEVAEEPTPPQPVSEVEPAAVVESVPSGGEGMPDWLQKLRDEEEPAPSPQPVAAAVATTSVAEPADGLPADPDERIKLARLARDKGELDEAMRVYDSLISSGIFLDRVIDDLEQTIKSYPSNYLLFQLMGDAMMKDGRLQSALDVYRQALTKL
jgi:hypothetical protein